MTSGEFTSIGMEELIANSITTKIEHGASRLRSATSCCIHKVPDKFHKMTEHSAYVPEVVSIGPYHRGKESLKATEDYKLNFMQALLIRKAVREEAVGEEELQRGEEVAVDEEVRSEEILEVEGLEMVTITTRTIQQLNSLGLIREPSGWLNVLKDCVAAIKNMETEIRECYSDPIDLESDELVEMMVVDGLFIIEYFRRHLAREYSNAYDPLFGKAWLSGSLYWDFLLLENQLPIFVLQRLFVLTADEDNAGDDAFCQSAFGYLRLSFPGKAYIHSWDRERYNDIKHLLDLFTRALHPNLVSHEGSGNNSSISTRYTQILISRMQIFPNICGYHRNLENAQCKEEIQPYTSIPGAVELSRAGVQFKKLSSAEPHSFLDIKFNKNGIFEIPPLNIDDGTDRWLRNLVASEQFGFKCFTYMTSYVILMDYLINSAEDVELLRNQGILITHLGSDKQVANMFNMLSNDVLKFDSNYSQLYDDVNKYYKKRQHRWKAALKRDYFNNPWAIVSFLAAVLLILLTIASTVFTTLSWAVPKS